MGIHCRLSTLLGERRLKMADVAKNTGLAKDTVRSLYYDKGQRVDYHVLEKICQYLDCQLNELLVYVREEDNEYQINKKED